MNISVRRKTNGPFESPPLSPLQPAPEEHRGVWKYSLPFLIALYIVFAVLHTVTVPTQYTGLQDAPDEAAHITYIRSVHAGYIPVGRRIPGAHPSWVATNVPGVPTSAPSYEWHQPPLYYFVSACFYAVGERGPRIASLLFGLIGILVIYRTARVLLPNDPVVATTAAGIAALTPTHIAVTSAVNNDALLELCFSATILILVVMLFNGITVRRACWLGAVIGAAILTKSSGILLLPAALFAFLLMWRNGESLQKVTAAAAWMTILLLTVDGWWFLHNLHFYGEPLPITAFRQSFDNTKLAAEIASRVGWTVYWLVVLRWTFQSFWAVYGTLQTAVQGVPCFLAGQAYILSGIVCIGAAIGLLRLHLRRRLEFTRLQHSAILLLFVVFGLVAFAFIGFTSHYFQAQGRYLYPAMLPICICMALGWKAIFPKRYAATACGILLLMLVSLDVALFRQIWVVYH